HTVWKELVASHFLVLNPETWERVRDVGEYDPRVDGFAVSPDGKRMVAYSAYSDSGPPPVTLWDFAAGKELARLDGHAFGVRGARFTPDGKYVVPASPDSSVMVWQAADGKRVRVIGKPMTHRDGEQWRPGYLCLD